MVRLWLGLEEVLVRDDASVSLLSCEDYKRMIFSISHELDVRSTSIKRFYNADVMSNLTIVNIVSYELYS